MRGDGSVRIIDQLTAMALGAAAQCGRNGGRLCQRKWISLTMTAVAVRIRMPV